MGRTKNESKINYQKLFGERLKTLREHYSLRQHEFAAKVDSSQSGIARIELGERAADSYLVMMIADNFEFNIEWLLTGKGTSGLK